MAARSLRDRNSWSFRARADKTSNRAIRARAIWSRPLLKPNDYPTVPILGAGPAGLAAAHALATGRGVFHGKPVVIDASPSVGGNSASFKIADLWCDFGSHRFHPVADPEVLVAPRAALVVVADAPARAEGPREVEAGLDDLGLDQHLRRLRIDRLDESGRLMDHRGDVLDDERARPVVDDHGASHMAKFMPQRMREIGTSMHRAASRFALRAEEGDAKAALKILPEVTSACVACHAGYRVQ